MKDRFGYRGVRVDSFLFRVMLIKEGRSTKRFKSYNRKVSFDIGVNSYVFEDFRRLD